ncbi:MAG: hypothetical protein ACPG5B_07975 [Chitinophagales bacterium]
MKTKTRTFLSKALGFFMLFLFANANTQAAEINLQFANASCTGNTYCVTLQVKTTSTSIAYLGNSTIYVDYNANAISNPTHTALNFTNTAGNPNSYAYDPGFGFLEQSGGDGEINYNLLWSNGTGSGLPTPNVAIGSAVWSDVAEFCFDVVDTGQGPNLGFDATYLGFNDEQNSSTTHTTGTLSPFNGVIDCSAAVGVPVSLKVFLQGPYSGGSMTTSLQDPSPFLGNQPIMPLAQPYNVSPWNYGANANEGDETLSAIPPTMTDWVLVEASTGGSTATVVERRAAVLLSNGDIVDTDGVSAVTFSSITAGTAYYFIVRHRNHLPIRTANAIVPSNSTYDLTLGNDVSAGGPPQMLSLGDGSFGMIAGNVNGDGFVDGDNDFDILFQQTGGFLNYFSADINMDKFVDGVDDFDILKSNNGRLVTPAIWP